MSSLRLLGLNLEGNHLTGPIPPLRFSDLPLHVEVSLAENELTGGIPQELSETLFWELNLGRNNLTGPIPVLNAWYLGLNDNELSGPIPEGITRFWVSNFANNPELAGPLPRDFLEVEQMEYLSAGGTDLCVPDDDEFQDWLDNRVRNHRIRRCKVPRSVAYLTQAIQSREFPVPLVSGEEAMLRVFLTAETEGGTLPRAIATLYVDGNPVQAIDMPPSDTPIPLGVDEGQWASSLNARVRSDVVQPGLELVVEVDPDSTLDPSLGVTRRIPETGRMPIAVTEMPALDLTLIPLLYAPSPDSTIIDTVAAIADDPSTHRLLRDVRTLLPVPEIIAHAHEPVVTDTFGDPWLLRLVDAIRAMEGGNRYYKGLRPGGGGIAYIALSPGDAARSSVSGWFPSILAHELGHNMGLWHAPCGRPNWVDSFYPYPTGSIGGWGYDFEKGELTGPETYDVMSYCDPAWISEYNFTQLMAHRLRFDQDTTAQSAANIRSLLVWGGVNADGQPYLDPAFVVDAPPMLPIRAGDYHVAGYNPDGRAMFSLSFEMPIVSEGTGLSFVFIVPADSGWVGDLAAIQLLGPNGREATLDHDSNHPTVIIRNATNGQVRGFLRDGPRARALARGMDILFSRGLPLDGSAGRFR